MFQEKFAWAGARLTRESPLVTVSCGIPTRQLLLTFSSSLSMIYDYDLRHP